MVTVSIIVAGMLVMVIIILLGYWFNWEWTGLGPYISSTTNQQREKTLWDWLQLLLIPLLIAGGGWWFNIQQEIRNQQQHKIDSDNAKDQQEEAALQSYLDHMSDLLLGNNTGKDSPSSLGSAKPNDEIAKVAHTQTLTILRNVNGERKGVILQFLYDAQLIGNTNTASVVVNLDKADLSGAKLSGANLSGAKLDGTKMSNAVLSNADLSGADLSSVDLSNANLNGATLKSATLNARGANLAGAKLINADLSNTDFNGGANLSNADLSGANLNNSILMGAVLQGANLSGAELWGAKLAQANLDETKLYGADLRNADLRVDTSLVKASYNKMTSWPTNFDPKKTKAIKEYVRILPSFVDFSISPLYYRIGNAKVSANRFCGPNNIYCGPDSHNMYYDKIDINDKVTIKFNLKNEDLAKTEIIVKGLITLLCDEKGNCEPGYSPINLQLNGHPFLSNYSMPGGGYLPMSQSFSAPPEQLTPGTNTLTLTVAPDAITYFWLYRLEVGLKSP